MAAASEQESRVKQVIIVASLLLVLTVLVCGAIMGWHYLPGIWGEWIGMMVGVMSTPFFMEASFIFIGLTIVVTINHYRQKRAGDDFVELEVSDSSAAAQQPADADQPPSKD